MRNDSMSFEFELEQKVCIAVSGEAGEIQGRAEYTNSCDKYLVRYRTADGRAVEVWWDVDALRAV